MGAEQGQEQVVIAAQQAADTEQLSAHRELPAHHPELEAFPGHGRAHLGDAPQQHFRGVDRLLGQHGHRAGLDDARLLPGYGPAHMTVTGRRRDNRQQHRDHRRRR